MRVIDKIYYPEAFHNNRIRVHWKFEDDLKLILEHSGHKADFRGKYLQRLKLLSELGMKCTLKKDWFEILKGTNGLYSMKFNRTQKNIRILFAFIEVQGVEYVVLLYPFEEKGNKQGGKHSYNTAIPLAQKRLKEIVNDD